MTKSESWLPLRAGPQTVIGKFHQSMLIYMFSKSILTKSVISRRSGASAGKSSIKSSASRIFISNLEKELQEERLARERLELEILEIKKMNKTLSTQLGLAAK